MGNAAGDLIRARHAGLFTHGDCALNIEDMVPVRAQLWMDLRHLFVGQLIERDIKFFRQSN